MTAKSKITLFNPEPTPVVYDEEGRTLGSVERVTLDELNPVAREAVDAGLLVEEKPEESAESKTKAASRSAEKTGSSSGVSTQAKAD